LFSLDGMRVIIRRIVFWLALSIAVLSWAIIRIPFPLPPGFMIHGKLSAEWLIFILCDAAFGILLLWSAVYLHAEAVLARIAIIVVAAPVVVRVLGVIWSLIHSTPSPSPTVEAVP